MIEPESGDNPTETAVAVSRRSLLGLGATGLVLGAGMAACATPESRSDATGLVGTASAALASGGKTREYWIQADNFQQNLVPTGSEQMMGMTFTPAQATYWAIGYRAYSENWSELLPGNDDIGPNTGIPGPVIRAEVGDKVLIHFRNNDVYYKFPHSVHTHGFRYTAANDGGYIAGDPTLPGRAVPVGGSYTYTWTAEPSSVGT